MNLSITCLCSDKNSLVNLCLTKHNLNLIIYIHIYVYFSMIRCLGTGDVLMKTYLGVQTNSHLVKFYNYSKSYVISVSIFIYYLFFFLLFICFLICRYLKAAKYKLNAIYDG